MALNIKNPLVEHLAREVATLAGETKTEAIRIALLERRDRLKLLHPARPRGYIQAFLEQEIWSRVPAKQRGSGPDKGERERILGYGEHGV